jgi:hypothetical protein
MDCSLKFSLLLLPIQIVNNKLGDSKQLSSLLFLGVSFCFPNPMVTNPSLKASTISNQNSAKPVGTLAYEHFCSKRERQRNENLMKNWSYATVFNS